MTTNSPNPVDGDVQALIADCQAEIEDLKRSIDRCDAIGTSDYLYQLQSKLKRQYAALAALTAEPCAFLYGASFERGEVEGEIEDSPGTDMPVFTTQPAQLLRPVELPDCVDDLHGVGPVMSADAVVEALRKQGYEVKND